MWWWVVIVVFFLLVIGGLFVPDIIRRERWERRVPKRRRDDLANRVDTNVLSRTRNPAAWASHVRYALGLWPFGPQRRLGGWGKRFRGPYPGDPVDEYLPDEEPPPGT